MRYQVPQFIDVESKIFGPLTFKQFIYLLGAGGLVFVLYNFLPLFLTFLFGLPTALLGVALAFYRPNNQPFVKMIDNAFRYITSPRLFLWKKSAKAPTVMTGVDTKKANEQIVVPRFTQNKLQDLAWSLDIKEKIK